MHAAQPDSPGLGAGVIVSTRRLAAPREAVFGACSDPAVLARWWGPKGFSNTFRQFEFHPGGAWRGTMRGPDGSDYPIDRQFLEILRPERIVVRHIQQGHDFVHTMTFAAAERHTELRWELRFADAPAAEKIRGFLLSANEENFDRLAGLLSAPPPVVR